MMSCVEARPAYSRSSSSERGREQRSSHHPQGSVAASRCATQQSAIRALARRRCDQKDSGFRKASLAAFQVGTALAIIAGWKLRDGWWTRAIRPGDDLAAMALRGYANTSYASRTAEAAKSHTTTIRRSIASDTRSRTCSQSSRTGDASRPATIDAPAPSSRQAASQQPSSSGYNQ